MFARSKNNNSGVPEGTGAGSSTGASKPNVDQACRIENIASSTRTHADSEQDTKPHSLVADCAGSSPFKNSLMQAVASPAVATGIGNTLFVSTLNNRYLTAFYACIAGLSFLNELRADYRSASSEEHRQSNEGVRAPRRGFVGLVREQLALPGICLVIDGMAFLGTGIGYLVASNFAPGAAFTAAICVVFAGGLFAGARLSNQGVAREPREPWVVEKKAGALWSRIPTGVQIYLQNPGALFATGNLPNYSVALFSALRSGESLSLPQTITFGVAAGCACAAAVLGMLPIVGKVTRWQRAMPCMINGVGNVLFGALLIDTATSTSLVNPVLIGCAGLAWGVSNAGLAIRILRER